MSSDTIGLAEKIAKESIERGVRLVVDSARRRGESLVLVREQGSRNVFLRLLIDNSKDYRISGIEYIPDVFDTEFKGRKDPGYVLTLY